MDKIYIIISSVSGLLIIMDVFTKFILKIIKNRLSKILKSEYSPYALHRLDSWIDSIVDEIGIDNLDFLTRLALVRFLPQTDKILTERFGVIQKLEGLNIIEKKENMITFKSNYLSKYIIVKLFFNKSHSKYKLFIQTTFFKWIPYVLQTLHELEKGSNRSFFRKKTNKVLQITKKRKDLSPAERLHIGYEAFSILGEFKRIKNHYGSFWKYGRNLMFDPGEIDYWKTLLSSRCRKSRRRGK
jgi:hypothetical protein